MRTAWTSGLFAAAGFFGFVIGAIGAASIGRRWGRALLLAGATLTFTSAVAAFLASLLG